MIKFNVKFYVWKKCAIKKIDCTKDEGSWLDEFDGNGKESSWEFVLLLLLIEKFA